MKSIASLSVCTGNFTRLLFLLLKLTMKSVGLAILLPRIWSSKLDKSHAMSLTQFPWPHTSLCGQCCCSQTTRCGTFNSACRLALTKQVWPMLCKPAFLDHLWFGPKRISSKFSSNVWSATICWAIISCCRVSIRWSKQHFVIGSLLSSLRNGKSNLLRCSIWPTSTARNVEIIRSFASSASMWPLAQLNVSRHVSNSLERERNY